MMNHSHTSLNNDDQSCVTFKSCEGNSIQVNKYFLFLYDDFYRRILDENNDASLVFIFEGATFDEIIILREQIYQKHLQCGHSQLLEDHQIIENNKDTKDLNSIESDENEKIQEQDKEENDLDTPIDKSTDFLTLECPFNCDEVPESDWTVDTLFAHIFSKHWSDVKNNYFVSIDTFIDRLSSELSSTKCALKCEKSKVYIDLKSKDKTRGLKTHYYRCHSEDPVICSICGDRFKNSKTYYCHTRSCHVEKKTCDLCNNGKIYKNIYVHMYNKHKEKKLKCEVEGCDLKFLGISMLKRHTIVVHKKEKPFVCDKCGIRMAQWFNLKEHRIKVHGEGILTFKEYKEMIRSGNHNFVPKESDIPKYR